MTYEYWSSSSSDSLKELARTQTLAQLAAHFGRTEMAVMHKLSRMGIALHGAKRAPRKPQTDTGVGKCRHDCPGGERCVLDADISHTLHCCQFPNCVCHSATRYEMERGTP